MHHGTVKEVFKAYVEAGLGEWGHVRHAVKLVNFHGGDITCVEGPGLITRRFDFKGSATSIARLKRCVLGLPQTPRVAGFMSAASKPAASPVAYTTAERHFINSLNKAHRAFHKHD